MPRPLATLTLAALALLAAPSPGQDFADRMERFRLFTSCQSMVTLVAPLGDDAAAISLTKAALQAAVESRLRAARLYTTLSPLLFYPGPPTHPSLSVRVHVVGLAFYISVQLEKYVTDASGLNDSAVTWESSVTGTHGRNASYIVSNLSELLDKFLADYLRVNEAACEAR